MTSPLVGLPTKSYTAPPRAWPTPETTTAEKAKRYIDYLVEYEVIAFATQEEYDAGVAKLTEQFGGKK